MSQTKKIRPRTLALGALVLLVLVILLAVRLGRSGRETASAAPETAAGVRYLKTLEAQDPGEVTEALKAIRLRHLTEMRDQWMRQLEADPDSVWSLFDDYVLLGDSRAVGFSYYGFLPEERVLAVSGARIWSIEELIPDMAELDPANIFLCYGINDIPSGQWDSAESFAADFGSIIAQVQASLPEAKVYVNSTLPVQDPAYDRYPAWHNLPQYNEAVKNVCERMENCYYVDNDQISEEYADLWEPDGIHVAKAFYPHWAANMMTAVYSSGLDWDGAGEETDETEEPPAETGD